MIAILCPTRGRPKQFSKMLTSAGISAKVYIGMDPIEGMDYLKEVGGAKWHKMCHCAMHDMTPTAQKWNGMAVVAMSDPANKLFMLGSDDMYFATEGWDSRIVDEYDKLENKIHCYALQDSRDKDGCPHIIVTREWIEFFGYFVTPVMLHWYVDTWASEVAKANGVFTHLKDYLLVHDKCNDRGQPDETHSRIRSFGWKDRDDFVWDACQHFLEVDKEKLKQCLKK